MKKAFGEACITQKQQGCNWCPDCNVDSITGLPHWAYNISYTTDKNKFELDLCVTVTHTFV